ncbi:metallophosphoesterase [uncultured Cohaesibacter sp.]|uniref:metallophosphoesterase n=1 Tax=uncultured Cohaesibacter sp. TaxID=1002546 RepID=UPI0029311B3C|nr:metallophosphoesterase [uncultured Cohaesibacter sp.]
MNKNPEMLKFIHMTDCHVAGNDQTVYGERPSTKLRAAIDSINRDHEDADFVVITGDLTHHGDDAAYENFARELRRLVIPSHLLMGNHDDTRTFRFHFPEAQRCDCGFIQGSKRTPYGLCLFLDTSHKGSSAGRYCEERSKWLSGVLGATDGPVMLFMHHPPFKIGIPDTDDSKLEDAEAFWEIVEPHKDRIRHIFVGHAHRVVFGNWRGISVSCMRGLNHQVSLELLRSGSGQHGNFEAPAYGIVLANSDQVMIHMHDFTDRSERFVF